MEFENEIRKILAKAVNLTESIDRIAPDTNLTDVGVDSLVFIQIVIEIENHFAIEFPDNNLSIAEAGTIQMLCKTVESLLPRIKADN